MKLKIHVVFLLISLSLLSAVRSFADDDFSALRTAAQNVKSVSADFIQEKHLKILAKPIISKGRLYFKAPRSIRWEYLAPARTLTLMNKNGAYVYIRSEGKWILDRAQSDARGIVMDEINNWFTGRFEENAAFSHAYQPGPPPSVILTPKEEMKKFISQISLRLSRATGLVEQVDIREGHGNSTRIIFQNEKVNAKFPDSLFEKP
ncbi:MAG: outer membrane lipoprotein carrier protein LolA [Deltaproteobacteria bacterium]|nr:outer membrane lipoprotein carrier protein LolA [Deltaproteobacteria bacterium]